MKQLIFKFPFKISYDDYDFFVSQNNFEAYKLIENFNILPSKLININGPRGSGKSHLAQILRKRLNAKIFQVKDINNGKLEEFSKNKIIIIDNYYEVSDIDSVTFYSMINQSINLEQTMIVNSRIPLIKMGNILEDLYSRFNLFLNLKIDLPTDDLMRVIIQKNFSDRQITVDPKIIEYIINRIDRSYERLSKFVDEIDNLSLSSGKSINLSLIKKVLNANNE